MSYGNWELSCGNTLSKQPLNLPLYTTILILNLNVKTKRWKTTMYMLRTKMGFRIQLAHAAKISNKHCKTPSLIPIEEDKIWDKAWRAQQAHVHGPKEGRAHSLCGAPGRTKAQTCPPSFRFLKTCSTRRRLALQGWDLLYKERRQDLTTIKSPNILIKRYAWLTPL